MGCSGSAIVTTSSPCVLSDPTSSLSSTLGSVLGEGRTAMIYGITSAYKRVAVKTFKCSTVQYQLAARREIAILSVVKHENLITLISVFEKTGMPRLVLELCEGGELFALLHLRDLDVQWDHKLKILSDVAKGMMCLHDNQPMIMHRDLKSLNILLSQVYSEEKLPCVKVSDMGSCRMLCCSPHGSDATWSTLTKNVGTWPWMAPEVPSGFYDNKADVYSFSMVMFEVLAQELPFEDFEGEKPSAATAASAPDPALLGRRPDLEAISPEVSKPILELQLGTWQQDPELRPSFATVLRVISSC
eukprot:CAMPEP_0170598562 /NCGR_PEP_ID=MMETSP0224-20130122/16316_1 /TAXON_ID=285029 /ORGANISM="Togula jolla, Strain CCCM 725" /LENGTH=301 /DNA_ID=CAMNT_0010923127 /DNA_START=112 /DNA_END=1014 /DNA_ORIENTATION=+